MSDIAGIPDRWVGKRKTVPVDLVRGQDFVLQLHSPVDRPFPAGSAAKFVFYESAEMDAPILATWGGNVSPEMCEFRVESETADQVPAGAYYRSFISFPDDPTLDFCLTVGRTSRQ